jgi:hypothetical protein
MVRLVRSLLALALILTAVSLGLAADDKMAETPWYPLEVGTTWHYKTRDGVKFVMKVVAHDKVGKEMAAKVELVVDEGAGGGTKKDSKASEHITVKPDGVYRSSFNGVTPDEPVRILKLPLKTGESWEIKAKALGDSIKGTFTVGEEKEITVPSMGEGKKYKAFPVTTDDLDASGIKVQSKSYYARDVGMVLQEIKIGM